jgi:lysophospholipase L1-like esterase
MVVGEDGEAAFDPRPRAPPGDRWRGYTTTSHPTPEAAVMPHPKRPTPSLPQPRSGGTLLLLAAFVAAASTTVAYGSEPATWSLLTGDRVVLLGDTVIEREGETGAIETALVATHPGAALTIRNLGWSGDTVWADSRGVFDAPSAGYTRMLAVVRELRPTIVLVAYGRNESFAGVAGLEAFRDQLARLCRDLRGPVGESGEAPPRLVLVTPPPFEATRPLSAPTAAARNLALAEYCVAIRAVAAEQGAGLVDLFADIAPQLPAGVPLTENGVHLTAAGYEAAGAVFAAAAGRPISGDFAGRTAAIRAAVNEKNRLFFHRWRPANETYLFLFRRHEQGNNAVEIPQFDPLVEAAEAKVRELVGESRESR